jgi:hypothetical protein
VIVTNQGNAAAAGFAVRVVVDDKDDEAEEKAWPPWTRASK